MRKLIAFCSFFCIALSGYSMVRAGVDVDTDDDDGPDVQVVIWGGPGYYQGIWFDNEWEYRNWHYNHYGHHGGHNHYHGGHGHHDGGGHHGGGGGGGHHGGGHH